MTSANELKLLAAEMRQQGWTASDMVVPKDLEEAADRIEELEQALRPFSRIEPSTLFDDKDDEIYSVFLGGGGSHDAALSR